MVFVGLILVLACLAAFHIFLRYSRNGRLIHKIPGPPTYPLVGNWPSMNLPWDQILEAVHNVCSTYYPLLKLTIFHYTMVGVLHPDDLEILFSNPKLINKPYIYRFAQAWLKTGLFTSTGDKWKSRRKILTPAFHFQILKKFMDTTNEQTEKLVETIRRGGSESVQSLVPLCTRAALNIICESAMGVSLDETNGDEYMEAVHNMCSLIVERTVKPYVLDWMMGPWLAMGRKQTAALKVLHEFTDTILKKRREYHKRTNYVYLTESENNDKNEEAIYRGDKKRLAMLDHLLLLEKKGLINEEGIKEEIDTFTFGGHDTVAMALVFCFALLAENKEVQDTARAEVYEVLGKNCGEIEHADLQKLAYVERCVKESLRLMPSAPMFMRQLTEDMQLTNYLLPAGVIIVIPIFTIHRNPIYWPNPEKFDPDRFLPDLCAKRNPYTYIPFSAGSRNCIGQKFAMNNLKALVARVLANFYLEPIDRVADVKLSSDLVIRPNNPIHTKFIRIDH